MNSLQKYRHKNSTTYRGTEAIHRLDDNYFWAFVFKYSTPLVAFLNNKYLETGIAPVLFSADFQQFQFFFIFFFGLKTSFISSRVAATCESNKYMALLVNHFSELRKCLEDSPI